MGLDKVRKKCVELIRTFFRVRFLIRLFSVHRFPFLILSMVMRQRGSCLIRVPGVTTMYLNIVCVNQAEPILDVTWSVKWLEIKSYRNKTKNCSVFCPCAVVCAFSIILFLPSLSTKDRQFSECICRPSRQLHNQFLHAKFSQTTKTQPEH